MFSIFKNVKRKSILWYIMIVPLSVTVSTAFAMSLQPVIDRGLSGDMAAFAGAAVWAVLCVVLDGIGVCLENVQRTRLVNEVARQQRLKYFKSFFRQPISWFAGKDSAYYLSKLTADAEMVAAKYCEGMLRIYKAVWSLILSIAVIAFTRWELAVYVFIFSFLSVNLPKLFQKEAGAAEQAYLNSSNAHMARAQESIRNYLLIHLHGLADAQIAKYDEAAADMAEKNTARQKKYFFMDMAAGGISSLSFVLIIVFAMVLVLQGKLSVGYIMSVSQLLGGIMFPFEVLPGYLLAYRTGRDIYRANVEELESKAVQDRQQKKEIPGVPEGGLIRLEGLKFAYQDAAPLLKGITLSLNMKQKYALVGASGSGKSTLSKIVMGFLPPEEGTVTVNGLSLEEIDRESLYGQISYQSQYVTFFQDTVLNNICLGARLSKQDIEQIVKNACLEDFLKALPERENSVIEEDGKNISGGEAQRIGLARSLAKRPRFMIFDEIAASLDNQTALEIEKTILSLPDVGMLMITHRIFEENMRRYDRIFVLKEGRISEEGCWDELMERKGDFYRLAVPES
ncbi:MAG: ABC transporter ATP-binding protein [Lachnospiraceae bacterium]|nr:ABC transporter ATP-binding protein [Lachnospiraceae bacterium]